MPRTALIIGNNALRGSLIGQYKDLGYAVSQMEELPGQEQAGNLLLVSVPDQVVVLTSLSTPDSRAVALLPLLAKAWKGQSAQRPLVHLLLQDASTLRMLEVSDFPPEVNEVLDIYPFTMESAWAENILVRLPGPAAKSDQNGNKAKTGSHPRAGLDRQPITKESRQFAHLVLMGFDSYAQEIALMAARVAHFPNYDGKAANPLRTRITVIAPGISESKDKFISRYRSLFENSYYRTIDIKEKRSTLHHPMYEGRREDFVDVEWEFADGQPSSSVVVDKLALWAGDGGRQLTLVISGADDSGNIGSAISLPDAVYDCQIPVWVRLRQDMMSSSILQSPKYAGLIPFGMEDCGYSVGTPLLRMARFLNYFYKCSYGDKAAPSTLPIEMVDQAWRATGPLKMRLSSIYNVMTMAGKMHSVGHNPEDLSNYYALTKEEIEVLSRLEHNRWSVERLLSGTRPCTDQEREAIRKDISLKKEYKRRDIHYDLCSYGELGVDETGKNVRIYDYALTAGIPLIVESYLKEGEV